MFEGVQVPGARENYARALAEGATSQARAAEDYSLSPKLPTHGSETFNLNPLLANCVLNHEYSRRLWEMGEAFAPLLQEAREKIRHVEPWQRGTQRTPSTAFCILVRLFQLGLTEAHMTKLLAQKDRPLVRAVGFLYLRYVLKPELLWRYCEDVLIDDGRAILEEGRKETLGEWLRGVLTSQQYHNTQLPRIPTKIDRDIRARVALVDEGKQRASDNARYLDRFEPGCQVRAIYGDSKNEPAWYDAVVESIEKDTDDAGKERVRFQVQFPDYGHGALVRLGDLDTRNNDSNGESLLKGKKIEGGPVAAVAGGAGQVHVFP